MRRILLLTALLASTLLAQSPPPSSVVITVAVDSKTYTLTLPAASISALAGYQAAANASSIPQMSFLLGILVGQTSVSQTPYADLGDLIIKHIQMLLAPVVSRYPPPAVVTAAAGVAAAQTALQQAVTSASAGAITVTGQ